MYVCMYVCMYVGMCVCRCLKRAPREAQRGPEKPREPHVCMYVRVTTQCHDQRDMKGLPSQSRYEIAPSR